MAFDYLSKNWTDCPYPARLIGIDHGSKTLGLSVSDGMQMVATPLETIRRTKFSNDIKKLSQLIEEYNVNGIVFGYPLNMDGSEGPRCQSIRDTITEMQSRPEFSKMWFSLWDERLSSVAIDRFLVREADLSRNKRANVIDKMAAQHILQGALDFLSSHRG